MYGVGKRELRALGGTECGGGGGVPAAGDDGASRGKNVVELVATGDG
jgi:hypothetical protein